MQHDGVGFNKYVFPCIIKACSKVGALQHGKLVHDDVLRNGVESDGVIGCALLDMYARCGGLDEARNLFDNLPSKDIVSWGAMIAGYAQHKCGLPALELFEKMQKEGLKPTNITFLCALKACCGIGALIEGSMIHDHIIRLHLESDLAIGNALIDMYAKCWSLDAAQNVFERLPSQNIVSYSALIAAFVQHGHSSAALQLLEKMQQKGMCSNIVTYLCILKACSNDGALKQGMVLHEDIIVNNAENDVMVANTLIDMYAKCGCLEEARRVFDLMPVRSTISWGAMSAGYLQGGHGLCALELYDKMQGNRVKPDNGTYVSVLKACASTGCLAKGKIIHEQIVDAGLKLDTMLGSTLIHMYAKCGDLQEAEKVFGALPQRDVVSWSALITGHVQHGQYLQALELFKRMQQDGVKPDRVVFLCVIKACSSIGAFKQGKTIHHLVKKHGFESDVIITSTLINMYAKCGHMKEARELFDGLPQKDAVAWGAIIGGYAHNCNYEQVKNCTEEMKRQGFMGSGQVSSGVLSACTLAGNIDQGQDFFKAAMKGDVVTTNVEDFNCAIDLFSRAGELKEAEHMLQSMPVPADVVGWTALLTACSSHGNTTLGRECYNQITQLDPNVSFGHSLMSKMYADAGMWNDMFTIQEERKVIPAWKKPGKAWIEVHTGVHEFTVHDESHEQSLTMQASLNRVSRLLRHQGYVPQVNTLPEQFLKSNFLESSHGS